MATTALNRLELAYFRVEIDTFEIDNVSPQFQPQGDQATLGAVTITTNAVSAVAITDGGSGYLPGQAVTITGDGTGADVEVATVDGAGAITGFTINSGGSGFSAATATIGLPRLLPDTLAKSLDIEHANMRFEAVIRGVSTTIHPLFTADIVTTGRTVDDPATNIKFTLPYDRPEFLDTEDETSVPNRLTGVAAIKRFIARELIRDVVTNREVFNPELSPVPDEQKLGPQILKVTAVKAAADIATAEAKITVTEIVNLVN